MRKIIFQMMVSLDGYFEGENKEIDWHHADEEFNDYAIIFLNKVDTLLFGRVTYQLMESYWTQPAVLNDDPVVAAKMNDLHKIVFSRTLDTAGWKNSRLIKENVGEEMNKLKNQAGKDMAVFGSSNLAGTFIELGLIDEFRIIVNPVLLGKGHSLLKGLQKSVNLKFNQARTFDSGNVMLCYER